jgi:hypothetical protein
MVPEKDLMDSVNEFAREIAISDDVLVANRQKFYTNRSTTWRNT